MTFCMLSKFDFLMRSQSIVNILFPAVEVVNNRRALQNIFVFIIINPCFVLCCAVGGLLPVRHQKPLTLSNISILSFLTRGIEYLIVYFLANLPPHKLTLQPWTAAAYIRSNAVLLNLLLMMHSYPQLFCFVL